jgi:hypothetical protein
LEGVSGMKCEAFFGGAVRPKKGECDSTASALNRLPGVDGSPFDCLTYEGETEMVIFGEGTCDAAVFALTLIIADEVDALSYREFFLIAGPISGAAFFYSIYYACAKLEGNALGSMLFAFLVTLRLFDLMSDWGMYIISLSTQHFGEPLRYACLAFSILGSLLFAADLANLRARGEHWFGQTADSEELSSMGKVMLMIVFLEDVPQAVITALYLVDVDRIDDLVAIASLAFSGLSMLANIYLAVKMLCCN